MAILAIISTTKHKRRKQVQCFHMLGTEFCGASKDMWSGSFHAVGPEGSTARENKKGDGAVQMQGPGVKN